MKKDEPVQLRSEETQRLQSVTTALAEALKVSISQTSLGDRDRDRVVQALDQAIRNTSSARMMTSFDQALIEDLESLVLTLRVKGASARPARLRLAEGR